VNRIIRTRGELEGGGEGAMFRCCGSGNIVDHRVSPARIEDVPF